MKHVLVTGGTGFIGSVLVEHLLERDCAVRVPIRAQNYRSLSRLRSKIDWREGDLRDSEYCSQILDGIDQVFHLASHRRNVKFHHEHASDVLGGNVQMTVSLIHALRDPPGIPVTFFSSANVPPSVDIIALAQTADMDGYVLGKAICEALWFAAAHQHRFPLLVVRAVGAYGERDTFSEDGNVIPSLMVRASTSRDTLTVWGTGRQERAFLYVEDLVRAGLTLVDAGAHGIQYVVPPSIVRGKELAEEIRDIVQPDLKIAFDRSKPDGQRSKVILPTHPLLDDFRWTPLPVGLRQTYAGWKNRSKHAK